MQKDKQIANIKSNHNIPKNLELKWTKISPSKIELYSELLNYFFSNDHLHFRCIVIPDKKILDHEKFNQTHDSWYYKMYFEMLHFIFKREDSYDIYLDFILAICLFTSCIFVYGHQIEPRTMTVL